MDVLLSSEMLFDRLGHEELELKKLGLVNHAAGVRKAIVILIREVQAARDQAPEIKEDAK
jgi:hypothetical protein